jgi:ubiquinone/menaquinone biosynthesis C-methylase UbiE
MTATASAVHPASEAGFGGAGLAAYEAARATYPPEAIKHVIDALSLAPGAKVLDVAAGTGKLTRELVALGTLQVSACEPNAGMLEGFARACPGVPVKQADAANLPYEDNEFDAVFVGQAYHCALF